MACTTQTERVRFIPVSYTHLVENFSLDSTFTVALDDVLDTIDTDNITGYDDLKLSLIHI